MSSGPPAWKMFAALSPASNPCARLRSDASLVSTICRLRAIPLKWGGKPPDDEGRSRRPQQCLGGREADVCGRHSSATNRLEASVWQRLPVGSPQLRAAESEASRWRLSTLNSIVCAQPQNFPPLIPNHLRKSEHKIS